MTAVAFWCKADFGGLFFRCAVLLGLPSSDFLVTIQGEAQ